MGTDWYDINGKRVELLSPEFMAMGKDELRRIGDTDLPDGRRVSTVHLGLDHRFGGGPPLIFETMVFPKDSYSDLHCQRYSTLQEARDGHERVVAECKAGQHMPNAVDVDHTP